MDVKRVPAMGVTSRQARLYTVCVTWITEPAGCLTGTAIEGNRRNGNGCRRVGGRKGKQFGQRPGPHCLLSRTPFLGKQQRAAKLAASLASAPPASSPPDADAPPRLGLWVPGAECAGSTPYERLTLQLHHDRRWRQEVSLGKRVGLYRMRGDLGSGNFSNVKMAVHQLTSGR